MGLFYETGERPFLLGKARARAEATDAQVEWIQGDRRSFVRPAHFDLAVNLFTSFGYFEDPADNQRVLECVRRSLKPDGAFVMEMMSKERLARVFLPSSVDSLPDGRLLAQRRKVLPGWSRLESEWLVLENACYERFSIEHFLYSGQELKTLLDAAGFSRIELYGGFDGSPFDGPQRLVAVARP